MKSPFIHPSNIHLTIHLMDTSTLLLHKIHFPLLAAALLMRRVWFSSEGSDLLPWAIWGWWDVLWLRRPERCCTGPVWDRQPSGYCTGYSSGGQQSEPRCRDTQPERTPPAGRPGYCDARAPGIQLCSGQVGCRQAVVLLFSTSALRWSQGTKRRRRMKEGWWSCWWSENQTGRTEEQSRKESGTRREMKWSFNQPQKINQQLFY